MNAYSNHYKNNQILTASPDQILVMLFDGAIRFVRQARFAIDEKRLADKSNAIARAIAIVTEFSNTLNHDVGGDIAADLSRLYDFVIRELSAVNAHNEIKRLDPVEKILLDLREGFAGAAEINRQSAQPQMATASAQDQRVAISY